MALNKNLAFLLGFGFAFLPAYGPFAGLLFLLAARWSLRRTDALWWTSALLLGLPLAVHSGVEGFLFGALGVLAPWLLYRTFEGLHHSYREGKNTAPVGIGLLVGLALVVGLGWLQIDGLEFGRAKTIAQAIVWEDANLYGHTVFVLGALTAILLPGTPLRLISLGIAALGILVSGSREAAIAWVMVAGVLTLVSPVHSKRARALEAGLIVLMFALLAGLGSLLGWGRVGFLVDLVPSGGSQNLVQGSEIAIGDWWDPLGVRVESGVVTLGDNTLTRFDVTKTEPEGWRRLQQAVPIAAGVPYTLSTWLQRSDVDVRPGLQGWGKLLDSGTTFAVTASLEGGAWQARATGPGRVLDAGIAETDGNWRRVWVTFIYEGDAPTLVWWVGLAPDNRNILGERASFAGFSLEQSAAPTPYTPGTATRGLGLSVARIPYWQAAWQGFLERPLTGWGRGAFSDYYVAQSPNGRKMHALPSHAHHLPLQTGFERGLVGLAGLVLFLIALSWNALRNRDLPLLGVVGALMIANLFDYTLFYGGVIYPLAAVAGWRAPAIQERREEERALGLLVRGVLATTDFVAALASFALALQLRMWLGALLGVPYVTPAAFSFETLQYALLLWPLMAWREGLYPGYGLAAPSELHKGVSAAAYAGLVLTVGAVLFYRELPLARSVLILTVLLSMVLAPIGRALAKRLLHRLGLWGEGTFVLGAGETGQRVARALLDKPLIGLRPVAFFDDDSGKHRKRPAGLPVLGSLSEAGTLAAARNVRRAIVAIPRVSPEVLTALTSTAGRAFRQVQFVPDITGLPSFGVSASSLDNLLALEVRNELNSVRNRALKRAFDLFSVTVGGLFLAPLVGLLALAVYLNTPGPVLFAHRRIGRGGRYFNTWKFRTMVPDAQAHLETYLAAHPELKQEWEEHHKLQDDPRVTPVGRFLRKYSLDELPQLWNVFVGEMSLVGPRPIIDPEVPKYGASFELFTMVRPGITGLWQTSGRSDTGYEHRVQLDTFYVRNWSVWLDIIILLKTARVVMRGDGAY